jgi:beta-glucosidase-like glycosyl hydrolase
MSSDSTLDLAAAVGRLIMPDLRADMEGAFEAAAALARPPSEGGIGAGGFLVFGGARETLPARLASVRAAAGGRPLLFASDLERGAGQQVRGLTRLPHLMAIGAAGSAELAYRAGLATAREARAAGIHLAFAPDADLNTDPSNPIINVRAFGDEPFAVGKLAQAWIAGCRAGGALSCAKHYPGHGHTSVDSHIALPRLSAPLPALMARELMPFGMVCAGRDAVDSVMTAHMAVPALTGDPDLAVTLSPRAIAYLRNEQGFAGLVFTDALLMGGITAVLDEAEAGARALAAGCDVLLCPADPRRLHAEMLAAVRAGRVPEARVRESLARLERAYAAARAAEPAPTAPAAPDPAAAALADEIAARGLSPVRGAAPVRPAGVLAIVSGDAGEAGGDLAAELFRRRPTTCILPLAADSPEGRLETVAAALEAATRAGEQVAVALFSKVLAWKGGSGLPAREAAFVERLCAAARGAAVVSCGSPYLLSHAKDAAFLGCAWSDEPPSQRALAAALAGEAGWPGTPPVALAGIAG